MKKKNCSMGMQKTVVSLLFCAQHRSPNPLITPLRQEKKKNTYTHTHAHTYTHIQNNNPEEASSSETTLCIYCIRGQSHSLPFLRTVYTQAETRIYTHTCTHGNVYTHGHTLPRLVFWPLKSFLLSFMLHTYTPFETNTPLFPSCSQISQIPA